MQDVNTPFPSNPKPEKKVKKVVKTEKEMTDKEAKKYFKREFVDFISLIKDKRTGVVRDREEGAGEEDLEKEIDKIEDKKYRKMARDAINELIEDDEIIFAWDGRYYSDADYVPSKKAKKKEKTVSKPTKKRETRKKAKEVEEEEEEPEEEEEEIPEPKGKKTTIHGEIPILERLGKKSGYAVNFYYFFTPEEISKIVQLSANLGLTPEKMGIFMDILFKLKLDRNHMLENRGLIRMGQFIDIMPLFKHLESEISKKAHARSLKVTISKSKMEERIRTIVKNATKNMEKANKYIDYIVEEMHPQLVASRRFAFNEMDLINENSIQVNDNGILTVG